MSFGMLKLGELGEVSFGKYKLGELGEVSFGMLKLGELGELWKIQVGWVRYLNILTDDLNNKNVSVLLFDSLDSSEFVSVLRSNIVSQYFSLRAQNIPQRQFSLSSIE